MLKFYLKRAIFVVLIVAIGIGYSLWKDGKEAVEIEKSNRYALAVAQLAVSEALHHDSDAKKNGEGASWQELKDSLLNSWDLNSDSVDSYVNSFEGREEKLAAFWKQVRIDVDSLTKLELVKLSPPDSVSDFLEADSGLVDSVDLK